MIFLEEISRTAHQAQQWKLASLGRLTAGIAHEVRNPLGAISHSGELLGESTSIENHDRRLVQIIVEQSRRMNAIIESVMQLGRRDRARPVMIPLQQWLAKFLDDFLLSTQTPADAVHHEVPPQGVEVEFDPGHLQQILWNLCQNGLRHSGEGSNPRIELLAGVTITGRPYLDVVDHGPGGPRKISVIFSNRFSLPIAREPASDSTSPASWRSEIWLSCVTSRATA